MKTVEQYHRELTEAFPPESEGALKKGGASLTYIPQAEVIARLNKVIGVHRWSSEVKHYGRDTVNDDWAIALVRLTATFQVPNELYKSPQETPGEPPVLSFTVVKEAPGGQKIKMMKSGGPVDLGDEFKGAVSDALKKAATQLGVALYLARNEEALNFEEQQEQAAADEPSETWKRYYNLAMGLTNEQKAELEDFWKKYTNGSGQPKPKRNDHKEEDLEALITEIARMKLGGEFA